jgi:hypothetical protein
MLHRIKIVMKKRRWIERRSKSDLFLRSASIRPKELSNHHYTLEFRYYVFVAVDVNVTEASVPYRMCLLALARTVLKDLA